MARVLHLSLEDDLVMQNRAKVSIPCSIWLITPRMLTGKGTFEEGRGGHSFPPLDDLIRGDSIKMEWVG